jgi:hypothetical protein
MEQRSFANSGAISINPMPPREQSNSFDRH